MCISLDRSSLTCGPKIETCASLSRAVLCQLQVSDNYIETLGKLKYLHDKQNRRALSRYLYHLIVDALVRFEQTI